jgi:hypothetical protein
MLRGRSASPGALATAEEPVLCVVDSGGSLWRVHPAVFPSTLAAVNADPDGFPWRYMQRVGMTPLMDSVQGLLTAQEAATA